MRSLGAEQAIDYTKDSFESLLHDLDAVIDTVGEDLQARSIKVLRQGGILVTVTGRLPEGLGKAEGVRATRAGRAPVERLDEILRLVVAGQLKPVVGQVFSLSQARQAQELSQTGHGQGRIILKIAG